MNLCHPNKFNLKIKKKAYDVYKSNELELDFKNRIRIEPETTLEKICITATSQSSKFIIIFLTLVL